MQGGVMSVQLEAIRSEVEDAAASVALYKILSYPADYTLEVLHRKWRDGEIIIPKFQRGFVWSHVQASRLIESFLMGLPVPAIFLYNEVSEKHLVIDGHQRLRSVFSFFEGKLPDGRLFSLKDVNERWAGKLYESLEDIDARRFRDSVLRAVILRQVDPKDMTSVYHVFQRLNTGGTTLTPQEVRNCVLHGPFNDFIVDLNTDKTWRQMVGSSAVDKRMRDVELIVRFFALATNSKAYFKPMKDFLSDFMQQHRQAHNTRRFRELFARTVQMVVESLGGKPFHVHRGLNAAVFDSVMVAFATSNGPLPPDIRSRYRKLLDDEKYAEATTAGTTDEQVVKARIKIAKGTLFGQL